MAKDGMLLTGAAAAAHQESWFDALRNRVIKIKKRGPVQAPFVN
jgi:hypothetical protein